MDAETQVAADAQDAAEELPSDRIADLGLVDDEDAVSLDVTDREDGTLIEIECAADDAGKVIGRHGRQIKAIRTIARALGQRVGSSVDVEVLG